MAGMKDREELNLQNAQTPRSKVMRIKGRQDKVSEDISRTEGNEGPGGSRVELWEDSGLGVLSLFSVQMNL